MPIRSPTSVSESALTSERLDQVEGRLAAWRHPPEVYFQFR